jgi:hypothetical protein
LKDRVAFGEWLYEEKGGYLVRVAGFEVIGVMMDLRFWKWVCGSKPRVAAS